MWQKLGEVERAAKAWSGRREFQAGNYSSSWAARPRRETSSALPDTDPNYLASVGHVAQILKEKGYVDLAVETLQGGDRKAGSPKRPYRSTITWPHSPGAQCRR